MKKISLEEIAGGALQEQFGKSFQKVVENLADPSTSFKEARKITIVLKFTQNETRDDVSCDVLVSEKLAAQAHTRTSFAVGKDLKTGDISVTEYGRNLKGQMSIKDFDVDPETGEILEGDPEPAKMAEIIDLRKANCN